MKPGNAGGGKGSQLKTDARSDEGHGALTMSLATPGCCSGVADGVTRNIVSLFREPDAGNLPVRCDEREQETESSQTGLRWRGRKPSQTSTGRLQLLRLFSTLLALHSSSSGSGCAGGGCSLTISNQRPLGR